MSSSLCIVLDELAARGQRLRGQLPGDYKLIDPTDPSADVPAGFYSLILIWSVENEMRHEP